MDAVAAWSVALATDQHRGHITPDGRGMRSAPDDDAIRYAQLIVRLPVLSHRMGVR
jgi:hypothetical protein